MTVGSGYREGLGLADAAAALAEQEIDVSVIMPCLDEESSVGECVTSARDVLAGRGLSFEVIVVDNGSVDGSAREAAAAGARVLAEPVVGYGRACRTGLDAARGRFLVLGDADGTYDFSVVPDLVAPLESKVDLVVGSRLKGPMEPGAMPWMHRWVGTPLLTGMVNALFRVGISDVNCGLRGIRREAYRRLRLSAPGMEFASELVVEAALERLQVAELPVPYRLRRGGVAKVRTWADGWRHLRLILGAYLGRVRHRRRLPSRLVYPDSLPVEAGPIGRGGSDADRLPL